MIISINFSTEPSLHLKFQRVYDELVFLQNFYQDKNYGSGVIEIAGSLVCKTPFQLQFIGIGKEYNKRKKAISFLTKINIEWVDQNEEPVVRQKCKRLLLETFKEFDGLNIKDFNISTFIHDFNEYLNIIETNDPHQLKDIMPSLNSETLKVHELKWKRFLKS